MLLRLIGRGHPKSLKLFARPLSTVSTSSPNAEYQDHNQYLDDDDFLIANRTEVLQLASFPYLRKMFRHSNQRSLIGTVYAKFKATPDSPLHSLINKSDGALSGWVDFGDLQSTVLPPLLASLPSAQREGLIKGVDVFFSPPHNSRSPIVTNGLKQDIPQPENLTLAVERDQTMAPEEMYRLDPMDTEIEGRLCSYIMNLEQHWDTDSVEFSKYLVDHASDSERAVLLERTSGSVYGWRSFLTELDPNDRIIVTDPQNRVVASAVHVGGRMLLHKLMKSGPVTISSFCDFVEQLPDGLTISRVDAPVTGNQELHGAQSMYGMGQGGQGGYEMGQGGHSQSQGEPKFSL